MVGDVVRRDLDTLRLVATLRWLHLLVIVVGSCRCLCTLAPVAAVGARVVVIVVALVVAAGVADVIRRDLLATPRAAADLLVVVPHVSACRARVR